MVELSLVAANFAPATPPFLFGCAPNALGFSSLAPECERCWLAIDGTGRVSKPRNATTVRGSSRPGVPRIDSVDPEWRLEVQARPISLVFVSKSQGEGRVVIELPPTLVSDVLALDRQQPPETSFARAADMLVLRGRRCVWWTSMAQLLALTRLTSSATRVRWKIRTVRPTGDPSARDEGVVLLSSYGRTSIRVNDRSMMVGATPLEAGERVTLVDRLVDTNGVLRYRAAERENGERIELEATADEPAEAWTTVSIERASQASVVVIREEDQRVLEAMRSEGLLAELTPTRLAELATPTEWSPGAPSRPLLEILDRYYDTPARAAADGYIAHEAWFFDETEDIVAELCARVGRPLFEQISVTQDTVRVRGASGEMAIQLDAGLYDVILAFNDELRALGESRRFYGLRGARSRLAFLLLDDAVAARLQRAGLSLGVA